MNKHTSYAFILIALCASFTGYHVLSGIPDIYAVGLSTGTTLTQSGAINGDILSGTTLRNANGEIIKTSTNKILGINDLNLGWKIFQKQYIMLSVWAECKNIKSPDEYDLFIPTRSQIEWNAFKAGAPQVGTILSECKSCETVEPTCKAEGRCTIAIGTPSGTNQAWKKDAIGCGVTCTGLYAGDNCDILLNTGSCQNNLPQYATANTKKYLSNIEWTHSTTPGTCTYTCNSGYSNDSSENKCIRDGTTRTQVCGGILGATTNATTSSGLYAQVWVNKSWKPELNWQNISTEPTENDYCWIKCDAGSGWNGSECIADSTSSCVGNMDSNGQVRGPVYGPNYTIRNGYPDANIPWHHESDSKYNVNDKRFEYYCSFQCKNGYSWDGSSCRANNIGSCVGSLPENTTARSQTTYTRSWRSNGTMYPSSTMSWVYGGSYCSFDCVSGSSWNGTICKTNPVATCEGTIPPNASIQSGPTYKQTWQYSESLYPRSGEKYGYANYPCGFICDSGYTWNKTTSECTLGSIATCPTGYYWNTSLGKCKTNYVAPTPSCSSGYHYDSTLGCVPNSCNSGYTWSPVTGSCIADIMTRLVSCGGSMGGANSKSTTGGKYAQASFDRGSTWSPTGVSWSYGGTSISLPDGSKETVCGYSCGDGSTWDGSTCK